MSNQTKTILVKYRNTYQDAEKYVFSRIDNQVMNRYLKEIAKLAGITKNLTTHVARHTSGTRLGASGVISAFTISELIGQRITKISFYNWSRNAMHHLDSIILL